MLLRRRFSYSLLTVPDSGYGLFSFDPRRILICRLLRSLSDEFLKLVSFFTQVAKGRLLCRSGNLLAGTRLEQKPSYHDLPWGPDVVSVVVIWSSSPCFTAKYARYTSRPPWESLSSHGRCVKSRCYKPTTIRYVIKT